MQNEEVVFFPYGSLYYKPEEFEVVHGFVTGVLWKYCILAGAVIKFWAVFLFDIQESQKPTWLLTAETR